MHLFAFLCFLCAFCAFCAFLCVKQKGQHFYAHKSHLRGKKSLLWRFVLFILFVLFMLFMHIKNIYVKVACLRFVLFVFFVRVKSFHLKNKTALIPSFTLLLILDIKFRFTCCKSDLYVNTAKFQNVMTTIVWKFSFNYLLFRCLKLMKWTMMLQHFLLFLHDLYSYPMWWGQSIRDTGISEVSKQSHQIPLFASSQFFLLLTELKIWFLLSDVA